MKAVIIHRHHDPHLPQPPNPFLDIIPNQEPENGVTAKKLSSKTLSPHTLNFFNGPDVGAPRIRSVPAAAVTIQIGG